jgi:trigger factor
MNISKENVDALNAVVKIKLTPDDYKKNVDKEIKKHQKNARVPGFRPGMVPEGMIRKMYGKAILAEELNKVLNDSLYTYLNENKIEILGNPLPKDDNNAIDIENASEFEFLYELGIAPEVNVEVTGKESFDYYTVKVDDTMLEKHVTDIRRRYGKFSNPEVSEVSDILYGEFQELNADGTVKEDGIKTTSTLAIELVKNKAAQSKFVGVKKDDTVTFSLTKDIENVSEISAMLGIDKERASSLTSDFNFTVTSINRIEKAELNQDLFDKLYGAGVVNSEQEFYDRAKEDISSMFNADADRKLKFDIVERLLAKANLSLPDQFLKRWIKAANEKEISEEEISKEYDAYAKGLKWRLIENKLIKDNNIQITADEVKEYARNLFRNQFAQYGQGIDEAMLDSMVTRYLGKEEQVKKLYENLADQKTFDFLKSSVNLKKIEVDYDEFVKQVSSI